MKRHLGLRYVYEDSDPEKTSRPELPGQNIHTSERLSDLPSEWKTRMKLAIEHVDLDRIHVLIEQIRVQDKELADAVRQKIDHYEYEKILAMLD